MASTEFVFENQKYCLQYDKEWRTVSQLIQRIEYLWDLKNVQVFKKNHAVSPKDDISILHYSSIKIIAERKSAEFVSANEKLRRKSVQLQQEILRKDEEIRQLKEALQTRNIHIQEVNESFDQINELVRQYFEPRLDLSTGD